jgi:hypothetical protein
LVMPALVGSGLPLDCEHSMNYVHVLFLSWGVVIMVRALVEEAATLASLALFLGMIAIWAQVIATLLSAAVVEALEDNAPRTGWG